jgi:hypothetical protein
MGRVLATGVMVRECDSLPELALTVLAACLWRGWPAFGSGLIGRPAAQDEAPVAIAAIDIAALVNLEEYARVSQRGWTIAGSATNFASAVAADAAFIDKGDFAFESAHDLAG